jgi:2-phospho-L-lactate transferase/gluconeogenesis factor (CofD/UPF0052 family)
VTEHRLRPVVVCGGSGTRSFAAELVRRWPGTRFLVNAYDDGASTGRVRRRLDLLGPSDLGKLVCRLAAAAGHTGVAAVLADRLPDPAGPADLLDRIRAVPSEARVRDALSRHAGCFVRAVSDRGPFRYDDLAVRNAVLGGARLGHGSYQAALDELAQLLDLPGRIVIVSEDQAYLSAVTGDGGALTTEEAICRGPARRRVRRLFLSRHQHAAATEPAELVRRVHADAVRPAVTAAAARCLDGADAVLYAPGTLYSSILPTAALLHPRLREPGRPRVLIANLRQEWDQLSIADTVADLARARAILPTDHPTAEGPIVDTVVADRRQRTGGGTAPGELLPADRHSLERMCTVRYGELEAPGRPGVHTPAVLLDLLAEVLGGPERGRRRR